jgi:exo-beta-1,3-glucanase (GH17 family)
MRASSIVVAAVFAALTFALWAWLNRPSPEPPWPDHVQGMAFSPFGSGQDPVPQVLPTPEQLDADLRLLAGKVTAVRTYSSLKSLGQIPDIAARHQLKVAQGAWVDRQLATNELEIAAAIDLANHHANVIRLVIGNEVILRNDLSVAELSRQLDRVRAAVEQPVSTAEPWDVWLKNPQLVEHVDYIAVHLLPYWEGIPVDQAIDYLAMRVAELERAYPDKQVVIAEVGWPSAGRTRDGAVASTSNEAMFLRRFLQRARDEGYIYYIMEAFDQPWKARYEGAVGAYWGVYNVDREPKFAFVAADRTHSSVANTRRDLGRARDDGARFALRAQSHARCARPQPARDRRLRRDGRRGLDHLRLLAAVFHRPQRSHRRPVDPQHVRRDRRADRRGA